MALEDGIPLALVFVSFLPAYIGGKLDREQVGQKILSWALYALSLFFALMSLQEMHLVLERLFGGAPTPTELNILNLLTSFNVPFVTYFSLFGLLLVLGIILWLIDYIRTRRFKKSQTQTE